MLGDLAHCEHHEPHRVAHLGEHRDLALVLGVEDLADRVDVAHLVLAEDQAGLPALPGRGVVTVGIRRRVLENVREVGGDVGHRALVELLHVAQPDHLARHPVGEHDDVTAA